MYRSFFNLARNPFEMSPDPYFFYPSEFHKEAVAGLCYGVQARKGFMVLTGEVGTGKTMVIGCFLNWLLKSKMKFAFVPNSRLPSMQFLDYLAQDLGVTYRQGSKSDFLIQLNRHLIKVHQQSLTAALIVDEAQVLSPSVLEEIRLLTNLETPQGKLLQVILVGQSELETKLGSHDLRQLKQRVALWFQLRPFSETETQEYVMRRLRLAGHDDTPIFSLPALRSIFVCSRGIPRLINHLCDNTLVSAYALGQRRVTSVLVEEVAADLHLPRIEGKAEEVAPPHLGDEVLRGRKDTGEARVAPASNSERGEASQASPIAMRDEVNR